VRLDALLARVVDELRGQARRDAMLTPRPVDFDKEAARLGLRDRAVRHALQDCAICGVY
jgi:hypothetical protein